ncbi:SAM hydrolase/SAM-dependent halogenase family protein [Bacillus sp. T33-2]|uniref:SAM hydrolase/SAM-dependent halogenase family protein n=1 Tax=Bacillus sp. T33-2 TaxID=2054168 RepID=UPI000C77DF7C|nr:S-adenosyl-l-methionine hydroxide adenosyltransferase family protein [Bacillus sp. T33-2]PLR99260.1 DNA-directed RNA polymerase subunit delta [Bacillus sp. T33-2]
MSRALVFQSDFGLGDGAVAAMYGVASSVSGSIRLFDLTHDIPQFNIWEASYRLLQTVSYWPEGTVFVSVVDPGVGSDRRSIVARTESNHYIVTPDNGTLTHLKRMNGIVEARGIDEKVNRLPRSGASHTFHGRDIFAYTGARLAAGVISLDQVGPGLSPESVVELPFTQASAKGDSIMGIIDVLDVRFGNVWSNIPRQLLNDLAISYGDQLEVVIKDGHRTVYKNAMVYGRSFADIGVGEPLVYVNSLDNLAIAMNQGSFAEEFNIASGINWHISIRKAQKIYKMIKKGIGDYAGK